MACTMNHETEYLTQDKYDELKKELEFLKKDKRKEIAEALEYAKSLGDLSENQEYHDARDSQGVLEDRINHIEHILKTATIASAKQDGVVGIGSVITVLKSQDKSEKTFTIVGSEEADASQGKISMRSPLGMAAVGKKKGDSFSFETPSGVMSYKILEVK